MTRQELMAKRAHLTDAIVEARKELDSLLYEYYDVVEQLEDRSYHETL